MKFLVVDDDPAILKLTQKLLELQGFDVDCCDNALEAIQTLSELLYDILITDATMPAFSGFDLIRSLRKRPELNYLSIAMLTGRSDKSDIQQAVQLGVQDYIIKPIDPQVFMEKIERLADRHRLKKEHKPEPLRFNGEMTVAIKIIRITDIGLSIESPYPLAKGTIVTLNIEELKSHGLIQNRFKAIFNSDSQKDGKVTIELLMLDLDEKGQKVLSKISKKWLVTKAS